MGEIMNRRTWIRVTLAVATLLLAAPASAQLTFCKLSYDLSGWSFLYKKSTGTGRITCPNGQALDVSVEAHGGGATFGTHEIVGGVGAFSGVRDVNDLIGRYFEVNAHGGAGGAGDARFMVKGDANLSLAGTGQGVSIGFAFGSFRIAPL